MPEKCWSTNLLPLFCITLLHKHRMKSYRFPAAILRTYRSPDPSTKTEPVSVPLWCPFISTPLSRRDAAAALWKLRRLSKLNLAA